jgi:hypothetical protein
MSETTQPFLHGNSGQGPDPVIAYDHMADNIPSRYFRMQSGMVTTNQLVIEIVAGLVLLAIAVLL